MQRYLDYVPTIEKKIKSWTELSYMIFVFLSVIQTSQYFTINLQYGMLFSWINRIVFLCMAVGIIMVALNSKRNFIFLTVSIILLLMNKFTLGTFGFKNTLLLFFLLPLIGFPKMLYIDFLARLSGYSIVVIFLRLLATHNVYNPVVMGWKMGLGFNNPNVLGAVTMFLIMELVVLHRYFNRKIFICLGVILTPLLFMSRSRTGIWGTMIFLLFILLFWYLKLNRYSLVKRVVVMMPLIVLIISIIFAIWYKVNASNAWVQAFDLFTSNRLQLGSYFFHKYGIGLFGHIINTKTYDLDTGYLYLMITQGGIIAFIFLAYYGFALRNLIKINQWEIVPAMLAILFVGLSENYFIRVASNPFLLVFGLMLTQFDNLKMVHEGEIYKK